MRHSRKKIIRRGGKLTDCLFDIVCLLTGAIIRALTLAFYGLGAVGRTLLSRSMRHRASRSTATGHRSPTADQPHSASGPSGDFVLRDPGPAITFAQIAGLHDVKNEVLVRTILPLKYPNDAERLGVRTGGGLLLYGPPGCGKTFVARAMAGELNSAFLHASATNLMDCWVGEAEKRVAALFREARRHARVTIFIDEIDGLVPDRRRNGSTVAQRVTNQFLTELDGVASHPVSPAGFQLLIAATNWPERLDHAVLRPGRIGTKIFVGPPDTAARREILRQDLSRRPAVADDINLDGLAADTDHFSAADIVALADAAARHAFLDSIQRPTPDRLLSYADFTAVLDQVKPSIRHEDMQRYMEFSR